MHDTNNAADMNAAGVGDEMDGDEVAVDTRSRLILLFSMFVLGACGMIYELIAGAVASYLIGNSIRQYSLVIGAFLAAMGLGAYLTQWLHRRLLTTFLLVQLAVGILGGFSALVIYASFAHIDDVTPVVLGITASIGALVGMEIPLVTRILRKRAILRVTIAEVLTLDYLGALLASIAFPFIVLPFLGLIRAALAFGALNVLIATFGTALFWRELPSRRQLAGLNAAALGLLLVGVVLAEDATSWLEDRLYQDEIIHAENTPYQRVVVTRWRDDIRLHLDGHLQFSSADEYRYHESLVLPAAAAAAAADSDLPLRVLVLGGGDGLAVRQVLRVPSVERIDLVDIDARVIELFREQQILAELNESSLSDERVAIHVEDAMAFLRRVEGQTYDVIVMDLPDPNRVETTKLYTTTFFGLAMRCLTARGVLVTQATSPFYARRAFWCIEHTMSAAAEQLQAKRNRLLRTVPYHAYVPSFGDWGFVLAVPATTAVESLQFERLKIEGKQRFVSQEMLAQLMKFPPDLEKIATQINTLDDPVLMRYHASDWSQWNE